MNTYSMAKLLLGLFSPVIIAGCIGSNSIASDPVATRHAVTRDGSVVGTTEREVLETDDGRQVTTRQSLRVQVRGTTTRTVIEEKTRTEDKQQNTVSLEHRSLVGRHESVTTAEIVDATAIVRRKSRGDSREKTIVLPAGLRFDNGAGLIRGWNFNASPQLEFFALDIRGPLIERVVYSAAEPGDNNNERALLRKVYVGDNLRSLSRLYFDPAGALLRTDQAMFGNNVQTELSSVTPARSNATNPVRASLVKSPYRISRDALNGHLRYTFGIDSGVSFQPPQTGEQRVTSVPDGFVLDICATCGPGLDDSAGDLKQALEATFWLQSDHPRLARFAKKIGESDATDVQKMARLESWARRRMKTIDFAGHFSAAEALSRRAGDCTEGAVVLAALGRAAGIPTRVASGIVYSRERYHGVSHAFTPHAWTLGYVDGKWQSFDMSLDGFDASHIALTISDGDPGSILAGHQLAALLRWDAMTEVRQRPANDAP